MRENTPAIDDILDSLHFTRSVNFLKIRDHPKDKVVFECPLDQLVEKIW